MHCLFSQFYGPQQFHPNTTFEDLRNTSPSRSTTPFEENQSLYWVSHRTQKEYQFIIHLDRILTFPFSCLINLKLFDFNKTSLLWLEKHPTIFEVTTDSNGVEIYTRAPTLLTSPYYRWMNDDEFETEAFPDGFRMIAHSTDDGAQQAGESGGNMLVECCQMIDDEEDCEFWDEMMFPTDSCDFLGIAFGMSIYQ